ncbi:MAG: triose-phosphate isomerase [Dehalococcoidia bacterium]|nr:triose-phosphate isomerase [Dehalococcoidia bacterium]
MRRPFIAGNWKMNTTVEEAAALVSSMIGDLNNETAVDIVLCPPFISFYRISETIEGTSVRLGAQNMYFKEKGAYTGEISPLMLKPLCQYVILGHSERRQIFGETDGMVNEKIKAALAAGLTPIFCIGETLEENDGGRTGTVITRQIREGLKDVPSNKEIVVAYEPIWAIGTGRAAAGGQAGKTIGLIRSEIAGMLGKEKAEATRILYGGSVTAANIAEFISEPQIDGALVGGASLKAADFTGIVKQVASIKAAP